MEAGRLLDVIGKDAAAPPAQATTARHWPNRGHLIMVLLALSLLYCHHVPLVIEHYDVQPAMLQVRLPVRSSLRSAFVHVPNPPHKLTTLSPKLASRYLGSVEPTAPYPPDNAGSGCINSTMERCNLQSCSR
jgi:hypothetical protein